MANFNVTLPTGRRVGATTYGDPAARRIVVFCHGAPGSSGFDPEPIATEASDVLLVGLDRPGYSVSDRLPDDTWPTVSHAADDIAEYLRASRETAESISGSRGLADVGVVGWGAGGAVALALAARHPHLVERLALVGTPAPHEQVPWLDEVLWHMVRLIAKQSPAEAIHQLSDDLEKRWADALSPVGRDAQVSLDTIGVGPSDASALELPGVRDRLDRMLRDAFLQGAHGLAGDLLSLTTQPWGFELGDVSAPTLLLYGEQDAVATLEHARWYASGLPDAALEVVWGAGQLVLVSQWRRVLDFVSG